MPDPKDKNAQSRDRTAAEIGNQIDRDPRLITAVKMLRELLPGDSGFGDPLSTAGETRAQLIGRRLADLSAERPGVLREAGLSALQIWQAVADAGRKRRGQEELTILFTDLAGFSDWALRAGDATTLDLLRDVSVAIEPPVKSNGGKVVKRLGDGMMAVFEDAKSGVTAVLEARENLTDIEVEGYRPRLRAGVHLGRPECLADDYFGVDVNVAARIAEQARADEVLVSGPALLELESQEVSVRKKRMFRAKGVPKDVDVYALAVR